MRRLILVLLCLVTLASACSLGPREDWAKAMRNAHKLAASDGGAHVRQSVTVKAIETNIRQEPQALIARSDGVVDFAHNRADLKGTSGRKTDLVYDDLVAYGTRAPGTPGEKQKPWARFDYGREPSTDIDDNDRRMAVGAALISPAIALEVLEGVLTGSIKEVGTGMKAGVETTHYTARLAPDAAIIEIRDEDRKEGVERMFQTLAVTADDFITDVWIDAQDRVRGLRFNLIQQKDRVNRFKTTVSWEFSDYAPVAPIEPPPGDETIRSDRFRDFVTELIREFT
jgi:hypothetical protein